MDNQELYRRCMANDEQAWEIVYNYVLRIAHWPHWDLRESPRDMAQSIVLFLIEKGIHEVRQPEAFRGFIRMVSQRKILDSFKKKRINTTEYNTDKSYADEISMDYHFCRAESGSSEKISPDLIRIISRALKDLPENCQRVLPRYFQYKLGIIESFKELAGILECPAGTVSAQITRCMRRLVKTPDLVAYYLEE